MKSGFPPLIGSPWASADGFRRSLTRSHGGFCLILLWLIFSSSPGLICDPEISLGSGAEAGYQWRVMTRSSIELAVQVFLVSLVIVFTWAFYKLMVLIGWL